MVSEAQKRANAKYAKTSVRQFNLKFYPADSELWEYLQAQPQKAAFLKELIKERMDKGAE